MLDPKLIEATRHGAIPKIGSDGTRPSTRYARTRQLPANKKDLPLIAIVIGGLGISASGTADAFTKLPATVTFALAPYGADLEKLAERIADWAKKVEARGMFLVPITMVAIKAKPS